MRYDRGSRRSGRVLRTEDPPCLFDLILIALVQLWRSGCVAAWLDVILAAGRVGVETSEVVLTRSTRCTPPISTTGA